MSKLQQLVTSMEETRQSKADPVRELRHWRMRAEQRFMTVIVKASKPAPPKRPSK